METVSLQQIIDMVLEETPNTSGLDNYDNEKRRLYRKFERLIEKLGADKETVKKGSRNYEFPETEVPVMKVLLSQLYSEHGVVAEFVNRKERKDRFSSENVEELIDSLLNEVNKAGVDEGEYIEMANFFARIYCVSPLRSIERCHKFIDMLAGNLQDMTYSAKEIYLKGIEALLAKEVALREAEAAKNCSNIAKVIIDESNGDALLLYNRLSPEIKYEYMKRDGDILENIQKDDALREYIEKKFGIEAEQIFGHVASQL